MLLVKRYDLELDQFHALYGFSAIVAVGILYSYRGSPFIKDKLYLLYGLGSLFIMGLGIRELYLHDADRTTVRQTPMPCGELGRIPGERASPCWQANRSVMPPT